VTNPVIINDGGSNDVENNQFYPPCCSSNPYHISTGHFAIYENWAGGVESIGDNDLASLQLLARKILLKL
jgi:regulator of sigma D